MELFRRRVSSSRVGLSPVVGNESNRWPSFKFFGSGSCWWLPVWRPDFVDLLCFQVTNSSSFCTILYVYDQTDCYTLTGLWGLHGISLVLSDSDYKNSCGVIPNSIEELAYNATAVAWSPLNQPVRVRRFTSSFTYSVN